MSKSIRIGVLVSGRGSNLEQILKAQHAGYFNGEIVVVISSAPGVYALQHAKDYNVKHFVVDSNAFADKNEYERKIVEILAENQVDLVCLAGYMRIIGPELARQYYGRMMNIHPALLPAFPGLHVQRKALEYGVKFSGCTVHFVDEGVDSGPIILQAVVPVQDDDTEGSLSARILAEEHRIFPEAIRLFCENRLKIEGRRVRIT